MNPADALRSAYEAIKNKNIPLARQLLRPIIESNPGNEAAWYLYAHAAQTRQEAVYCLQKTLELNPYNEQARRELRKLQGIDSRSNADPGPEQGGVPESPSPAPRTTNKNAGTKRSPLQSQNLVWILGGGVGLLLICCLALLFIIGSQLPLVTQFAASATLSAAALPPATWTPPVQLSNPPTQVAGCSCEQAIPYLNRTADRYQQLINAVNTIEQAIQNGTVTQLNFASYNGQAQTLYHDQVAEVPPPCLQSFQTKTVAFFWNWQQSMEYVASGQYASAQVFIQQFQEQIDALEEEGRKIRSLLLSCPGNQAPPNSTF